MPDTDTGTLSHDATGSTGIVIDLDKPRRISINLFTIFQAERELEQRHEKPRGDESLLRPLLTMPMGAIGSTRLIMVVLHGLKQFDPTVTFEQAASWFDYRLFDEVLTKEVMHESQQGTLSMPDVEGLPLREGMPLFLDMPRRLRLGFQSEYWAEREYEQLMQLPDESIQFERDLMRDYVHAATLLVMLRNGLRTESASPPLSLEQVGKTIPLFKALTLFPVIDAAWKAALPVQPPAPETAAPEETPDESPPSDSGMSAGLVPATTSD